MNKLFKRTLCAVLATGMALSMTACGGGSSSPAPTPAPGASGSSTPAPEGEKMSSKDTLTVVLDREPASLDPAGNNVNVKRNIEKNIFDTLLTFDKDMKPVASLAESWKQLDDLTWEFKLRQGVMFSNGEELTAEDVKFSIERQYDSAEGKINVAEIDKASLQAPDKYTFIMKTNRKYAFTEQLFCSQAFSILNKKAVTEMGETEHSRSPVGTGAFTFKSWTAGDNITVERNDNYWGEKAKLKTIIFRVITESATRDGELEAGGVDVVLAVSSNNADRIAAGPDTQLVMHTSTTIRYIAFNCQKDVFKDKRVRQALNYATDAESIRQVVYGETTSQRAISPVAPGLPGRNEDLVQYEYNVEKAKALLKEAGVENGFKVEFMYLAGSANNMLAEMLQDMWKQVNVELILMPTESGALTTALNKGEQELCSAGTSFALTDPGDGLYRFFHSSRINSSTARANLSNTDVDKLLDEIVITTDLEARNKLVYDVQAKIHDESPFVYLANPNNLIGMGSKVRGFETSVTGIYDLAPVYFVE